MHILARKATRSCSLMASCNEFRGPLLTPALRQQHTVVDSQRIFWRGKCLLSVNWRSYHHSNNKSFISSNRMLCVLVAPWGTMTEAGGLPRTSTRTAILMSNQESDDRTSL